MKLFWLEQQQSDVLASYDWLGPTEKLRLDAMRFPKRRADWLLGRWTAKRAIASVLGASDRSESLQTFEIGATASGEPQAYADDRSLPITISISHRAGVGLCVVATAGADIGCDLEVVEQRSPAFAADYFTAEERAFVARRCASERDLFLNLLWSSKESTMKALHQGLRLNAQSLSVNLDSNALGACEDTWPPLRVRYGDKDFFGRWSRTGGLLRTVVTRVPFLDLATITLPPQA
jgi:4'-phosphopantetheinyl transferase